MTDLYKKPIDHKKYFNKDQEYVCNLENNMKDNLTNIFINSCFYSFIPDNFTEQYNFRTSFFVGNFLKDYIKNKHFCHIGGASGDLELFLSKYAKKITIIDIDSNRLINAKKNKENLLYKCPVEIINDNFFNKYINADIYFTWCGTNTDLQIINYIKEKNNNCLLFSPNIPYYNYINNLKLCNDYLIPFDENFDISYYSVNNVIPKIMINNENKIILVMSDYVYLYNNNMMLENKVNKNNFDFTKYKNYIHPYLLNNNIKTNTSPAANLKNFREYCQINLRGYIAIGFINF